MRISLAILVKNRIYPFVLRDNEKISIGSSAKDSLFVQELSASQISLRNIDNQIQLIPKSPFKPKRFLEKGDMLILVEVPKVIAFISNVSSDNKKQVELPENQWVSLGRKTESDIAINSNFVSKKHISFRKSGNSIYFRDEGSKNGIYLNGQRNYSGVLTEIDTLQILTLTITNYRGSLIFSNIGNLLTNNIIKQKDMPRKIEDYKELNKLEGYPYVSAEFMLTKKIRQTSLFSNLEYQFEDGGIYSAYEFMHLKECGMKCMIHAYHYYENDKHTLHYLTNRYRALSNLDNIIYPHELLRIYCNIFLEVNELQKFNVVNVHKINWNPSSIFVDTKTLNPHFVYVPIQDGTIDNNLDAIHYLRLQLHDFVAAKFGHYPSVDQILKDIKNGAISVEQLIERLEEHSKQSEAGIHGDPLYLRDMERTRAFHNKY